MTISAVLFDSSALRNCADLFTLIHPAFRHFVGPHTVAMLRATDEHAYESFVQALMARRIENLGADASSVDPPDGATKEHADILGHASLLLKDRGYTRVLIVYSDSTLKSFAKQRQIASMEPVAYLAEVQATVAAERQAADKAAREAAEQTQRTRAVLIREILFGFGIVGLAILAWQFRVRLVSTLSVWGTVLGLTVAGPLLYALRGRLRLMYGIAEGGIGLFSALSTVAPFVWPHGTDQPTFGPAAGITILGGLYVTVRGLDNIGTSLKGTTWDSQWRKFSGERTAK